MPGAIGEVAGAPVNRDAIAENPAHQAENAAHFFPRLNMRDVRGVGRHALETNRQGVFAIGDVRSGSVKRVAAAVGESNLANSVL
jgi:thioredoxin reductase